MVALWHIDENSSELRKEISIQTSNLLLRSKCSMISTGTENMVASGRIDNQFQEKMKVPYQMGNFELPIKYGYSLVVMDEDERLGHVMHPHQDKVDVIDKNVFWIDNEIPAHRLALISNMETVINAIWDSNPTKNDKIAICGFGNIGSLLANTLRLHLGIEVLIIEENDWRKAKAQSMGWKLHAEESYDIVYHTTATENGLQFCLDHLGHEGKLIELSWYGNKKVTINLGKDFHYNRLKMISSQVSNIPKNKKGEYSYATRKKLAFDILKDSSFDELITNRIPFSEAPDFFDRLRKGNVEDGLIYLIEY